MMKRMVLLAAEMIGMYVAGASARESSVYLFTSALHRTKARSAISTIYCCLSRVRPNGHRPNIQHHLTDD